ncbi:Monocarboxylate permease Mch4 [Mycena chlorophos]|uniref:Monocarboxylate permease Mch4 n=1 Tax=Mycena chlorophos TaxID=658473 RepID=A0A8H6TCL2_MYCCL|nr:Monocarboxylate permease Mch4 [Mycena chlorophos]
MPSSSVELVERRPAESTAHRVPEPQASVSDVPDGGYGWVVLFGCAVITWWFAGLSYSWGVTQAALVKQGLSTPSTLSFVGSTTVACIAGLGVVNARIIRYLGARKTGVLGIGLLGLGELLSSFATRNIGALFVTAGAVAGIGTSLCFMVVSTTPSQYFQNRRGLANGIVYASGGLGGAVCSFVIDALVSHLGLRWTFRILGLLTLATGLPAAWLVTERTTIRTGGGFIDPSLFRDPKFIALFLAGALGTFPLFVPPFFLPLYSASLHLSPSAGAGLVATFNFASALGRLACGFASDRLGPINILLLALVLTALSMLAIWPVSDSFTPLIVFAIINGASNGGFFATMPTVVTSVFGAARVGVAMGMIVTGWVGGYLLGAPIAGYILAAYGGRGAESTLEEYHPAMFWAGSMAAGAAGCVSLLRFTSSKSLLAKV